MKKIDFEELNNLKPKLNLALVKKLPKEEQEKYADLYSLYSKLAMQYINKHLNLSDYETKITNSGLNFKCIEEKNMDIYQYLSSENLKYFYLRNTLYIENLDKSDYETLIKKLENEDDKIDEVSENLIKRTFGKIINPNNDDEKLTELYGPDSGSSLGLKSAIILGFRYDEFDEQGLSDEEWDQQHDKQVVFLSEMLVSLEEKANKVFNIPTQIIQYNDFSVKTRENYEVEK